MCRLVTCLFSMLFVPAVWGLEHVAFQRDGVPQRVSGKVLVEAQDGGVLVLDRGGALWAITPDEQTGRTADDEEFKHYGSDELAAQLLRELPDGFRIHTTARYVIGYNTSPAYAQWCGSLLERLHSAFTNYWDKRGLPLQKPAGPLVALVFDHQASFSRYARRELGDATSSIIGYYSLTTNRVTMYDLTGGDALNGTGRGSSLEQINRVLSRPGAEKTVATVVHEATHQIAYNCGLLARYADIPMWFNEGIAIYFETPDLQSARGWSGIGKVHRARLTDFRRTLAARPEDSLTTLLTADSRFRQADSAPIAYAESWLLVHLLLKRYPKQFQEYMRLMSEKKPLLSGAPEDRLAEFRRCFGLEPAELDRELLRYAATLR